MLLELKIEDYALIEEVELEFGEGFNVLSGETGTGKSIIIGAVTLLLGGRAALDHVRTGSEEAVIHGVFSVLHEAPARFALSDLGIDVGDDGLVVISRTVSRSGRSRFRVNGQPVTQAMLCAIGEHLVDIHGQHEHQSLLRPQRHIQFLDDFAGEEAACLRDKVKKHHERMMRLESRLADLRSGERERAQRLDLLEFQAREIDAARLAPGEDVALAKERAVLASAGRLYAHADAAHSLLYGSDDGARGASDSLAAALAELEAILGIDDSLRDAAEFLNTAQISCEEAAREIRRYRDSIDQDPQRLAQVEGRLSTIHHLRRKYGDSVDQILEYRRTIERELSSLSSSEGDVERLETELSEERLQMGEVCLALHEVRRNAARTLEDRVAEELGDLAMGSTVFQVNFSSRSDPNGVPVGGEMLACGPTGSDVVEFLFSANPGEPPKPLARIASGGESSRVMLALKAILASVDEVGTLIFDEIDAGIGGRTATAVGEKLAKTSRARQVVCVTHLPQIACMADVHYSIGKEAKGGRVRTTVARLSGEARVQEIARMLGGEELASTSVEHAKEMLRAAGRTA